MLVHMKKYFVAPTFEDKEKTRVAQILYTISLVILVILVAVCVITPFVFRRLNGLIASGITTIPVSIMLILIRKGKVRMASMFFAFSFLFLDTALIVISGGLEGGIAVGYIVVVIMAGLLLGGRTGVVFAGMIALLGLGMVYAERFDLLPMALFEMNLMGKWISLTANTALAATILYLVTNSLSEAIAQAESNERAMEDAADELRKLKDFHENIVKSVGETIFIEDENGTLSFVNPRIENLLGYKSDELVGKHWSSLIPISQKNKVNEESSKRSAGIESQYETLLLHKEGAEVPVIVNARPLFEEGKFVGAISTFTNITERKKAENQLLFDALHDGLTGLPNRVLFDDRLNHVIARAQRRKDYNYAVLFMDLDRFKVVNDSLGHNMGDELLVAVGKKLSQCIRAVDTVARFGGDEFVVLLDDVNGVSEVLLVVNRIQNELRQPFRINGHTVFTSVSIGIVMNSEVYHSPEDIIRDADTAMYRAKNFGKDRFELFDPEMRQDALTRLRIESELRLAFDQGELMVCYQPLISIKTDRIVGFEALLRWQHPVRGLLLPDEFLNIAEETGIILPIGRWALHEACQTAKIMQDKYKFTPPLLISVNLSRKQFFNPELPLDISHILEDTGLEADNLRLEICEDVIMEDTEKTITIIQQILDSGVQIQMDDFGIGYSSLATLHRFPIEALKIPREFITMTDPGMDTYGVASTIISLAKKMNIAVIAEGVETPQQLDFLRKENCDFWQGHLYAQAMNANALDALLAKLSAE
jgi:diguanylate cyclase (GGDEF)-like protein/PAS domain S-box-containing protein